MKKLLIALALAVASTLSLAQVVTTPAANPAVASTAITGVIGPASGGTGVANAASQTLTRSGAHALTITTTGTTDVTLPTTGALVNTAGNVATATALAADPADCGANTFANAINASGTLSCVAVPYAATTGVATSAQGALADTAVQPSTAPTLTGTNFSGIPNAATTATATNTISTIVARDSGGGTALGFAAIGYLASGTGTTASVANGAVTALLTVANYNAGFVALRGIDNTAAWLACYYYVDGAAGVHITNFITGSGTFTCTTSGNNALNITNNTGITTSFRYTHLRLTDLF